ncbi:MAG: hypothetical protein H7228_13940 [Polaromonas sp.]|nr:hypothetical protein [Polaromonas sp.]
MTAYLLTNHVLNLIAPALFVAIGLVLLTRLLGRFLRSKRPPAQSLWVQAAIIFIVNLLVLATGLVFFGNDAKMLTYAAMVLAAAVCQAVLLGSFRA